MNRFSIRTLSLGVALGLASVASTVSAQTWSVTMNGANEAVPNASTATGFALLNYDSGTNLLRITGAFSGLSGLPTGAHLHCCTSTALTGTAGVATAVPAFAGFPLDATGAAFDVTLDLASTSSYRAAFITESGGTAVLAGARLIQNFNTGNVYFNIHTVAYPAGEIRGFVTTVPEPSTVLLMTGGLVAVAVMARRRRGVLSAPQA